MKVKINSSIFRAFLLMLSMFYGDLFSSQVWARVQLGDTVDAQYRQDLTGAYFLTFYTRTCLDAKIMDIYWAALRDSDMQGITINPIETGNTPLSPLPQTLLSKHWRTLQGTPVLELTRKLKIRTYPTTVFIDHNNRIRDVLEGPIRLEQVQKSLNLLAARP